ncbi:MAG: HAMP domain-containing histidine kinase [Actinobacteria bacterium]|nr:HAMP domain-containing histidine kinase [Actinomycetota bacterium]
MLVLGLLSLFLFGALFAFFAWRENDRLEKRARAELVEQAKEMARDLEVAFNLVQRFPDLPAANQERITQLLRLEGKLVNAVSVVVDAQGYVVAPLPLPLRYPRRIAADLLAEDEARAVDADISPLGSCLVVAIPLNIAAEHSYHNLVVAKRRDQLLQAGVGDLIRYLAIAGGAALVISVLLALYLSNYVTRPLHRLSRAAWEMAHGNLESRVEVEGRDEISSLARYFNYMAERLQRGYQQQKEFVANVSHEIRTPLTSIEGFTQALLDDMVEREDEKKRYLRIIQEETRRLQRVLAQLLALSRLDAGAWILHPETVSLPDLLGEVRERLRPRAEDKGLAIELFLSPALRPVESDRVALEQVFTNILDNAVKFTPQGGTVHVSADPLPRGGARIQVRDSGPGIPEEDLEHIFDRFFRVERSRSQQYGGSGLGLAVCRELVRLLGGRITAWSQPGKGSVFTVELPGTLPEIPGEMGGAEPFRGSPQDGA